MLDALDEADKGAAGGNTASSSGGGGAPASALDNKVLQLLLHQLALLPPNVRLLTSCRPERHLVEPLRSRFPRLQDFAPSQLRRPEKTQAAMQVGWVGVGCGWVGCVWGWVGGWGVVGTSPNWTEPMHSSEEWVGSWVCAACVRGDVWARAPNGMGVCWTIATAFTRGACGFVPQCTPPHTRHGATSPHPPLTTTPCNP